MPAFESIMSRSVPLLALIVAFLGAGDASARQAATSPAAKTSTFTLLFENDLFGDTDARYTNGIQIGWVSPDLQHYRDSDKLPEWAARWVDRLHVFDRGGRQRNIAFVLGQKMFTPVDIASRELIPDDRPYAGWLYFGAAFHSKDYHILDTMEVQVGMVGPASLAEQAQDLVHELRGIPKAQGWDNQLDNEPGLALIYERKWRAFRRRLLARFEFDAITHVGATLGNIYTFANAGVEARLGWNLPTDFGTSLIRPGGEANAPSTGSDARLAKSTAFSIHGYAAVTGRLVGRDIFLDGNTFSDSHDVDKKLVVGDLLAGIAVTWHRWKLSYAQVFRTKEFDGQPDNHEFGSISLSYTF